MTNDDNNDDNNGDDDEEGDKGIQKSTLCGSWREREATNDDDHYYNDAKTKTIQR